MGIKKIKIYVALLVRPYKAYLFWYVHAVHLNVMVA